MSKSIIYKLTASAVFAAIIFVATMFISIRLPNGYANLGDCFVIVGALVLGKYYGAAAAAIGSGLADIISGFVIYAPATIIIKALMAICVSLIVYFFNKNKNNKIKALGVVVSAIAAEIIMVLGYYLYEILLYGLSTASLSVVGNVFQGIVGLVTAPIIYGILLKTKILSALKL